MARRTLLIKQNIRKLRKEALAKFELFFEDLPFKHNKRKK